MTRRDFLARKSTGFGLLALEGLLNAAPHHAPKADAVIFAFMSGGVSHIDSFDPKPRLDKDAGKPMPFHIERTMFNQNGNIMPSPWAYKRYGKSGIPVSDLFPRMGEIVDDIAVVRSMTVKFMEHAQANFYYHAGQPFTGFPSLGAWTTYGLGSASKNLPGFVVLSSGEIPLGGINVYGSGFLPAVHQASFIHPDRAEPLQDIKPKEADSLQQRRLRFIEKMDQRFTNETSNHPQVEAAIKNYETAYRMQAAVPELCDLTGETEATKKLYGVDDPNPVKAAYARQCLLARRLVERGVRFIELTIFPPKGLGGGNSWDQHGQLKVNHEKNAIHVDQPIMALVKDLKARGMLDRTLVLWSGEFGRAPFVQGSDGRDHNPFGFSLWMAGGGIKDGVTYGETDEYGYRAIEKISTVHDLHATILNQLGIDHTKLTFRFGGRDFRLTDVHGNVMREIVR